MIISFEGIDGSGKGTQAKLLYEALSCTNLRCEFLSFPRYGNSRGAKLIELYLNGKFINGTKEIYGPAMFFALDRFETLDKLREFSISQESILVIDRYSASNLAHQSCKETDNKTRRVIQREIFSIEHELLDIPIPDATIFLDIDSSLSKLRVAQKPPRQYTEMTHDLHESDENHLFAAKSAFKESLSLYPNVISIDCQAGKDPEVIASEIKEKLVSLQINTSIKNV